MQGRVRYINTLYTHFSARDRYIDEDALWEDADEEFIDPIMQTLMLDPVKLPTVRVDVYTYVCMHAYQMYTIYAVTFA